MAGSRSVSSFPYTLSAAALLAFVSVLAWLGDIDLIRIDLSAMVGRIEKSEIDEIAIAVAIVIGAVILDAARARRAERVALFRATMATVQGIAARLVSNLQVFRLDAAERLAPQLMVEFDDLVAEAQRRLEELAAVRDPVVTTTERGGTILYGRRRAGRPHARKGE